jgi:hypothetical protein
VAPTPTRLIVAAVLSVAVAGAASADPIHWEFRGAITDVHSGSAELFGLFPLGGEAVIGVTIDPEAGEPCGPATQGCFHYQLVDPSVFTFDATIAGHRYFFPNLEGAFSNERINVHPDTGQLFFDNSLSEHLSGDIVGTAPAFRPHALDFFLTWPGVTFGSYDIPGALPTSPLDGTFSLYLWTCNDVGDPSCVRQDAQVRGDLTTAVQIDEPLSLATLALGLVALVGARRALPRLN